MHDRPTEEGIDRATLLTSVAVVCLVTLSAVALAIAAMSGQEGSSHLRGQGPYSRGGVWSAVGVVLILAAVVSAAALAWALSRLTGISVWRAQRHIVGAGLSIVLGLISYPVLSLMEVSSTTASIGPGMVGGLSFALYGLFDWAMERFVRPDPPYSPDDEKVPLRRER